MTDNDGDWVAAARRHEQFVQGLQSSILTLRKANASLSETASRLADALAPFAEIALWKDTYPDADHDRIDGPDLCVTPDQVRAARKALG